MANAGFDMVNFEILEDGTISIKTDRISGTNHIAADQLLAELAKLAGGEHTSVQRTDVKYNLTPHLHAHTADGHTHENTH
jgi:hypothetical protein